MIDKNIYDRYECILCYDTVKVKLQTGAGIKTEDNWQRGDLISHLFRRHDKLAWTIRNFDWETLEKYFKKLMKVPNKRKYVRVRNEPRRL